MDANQVVQWLKDNTTAPVASLLSGLGVFVLTVTRYAYNARRDQIKDESDAKDKKEADHKEQMDADRTTADSMTKRFQALMDGYEGRIRDLTEEVTGLRIEVKNLRKALDQRTRACMTCVVYQRLQGANGLTNEGLINGPAAAK